MDAMAKIIQEIGTLAGLQSSEDISKINLEELRLEAANATTGKLGGLDCPICKNRGYIYFLRQRVGFPGELVSRECQCMTKRRGLLRIERSGLKDALSNYTFESYQTPHDWQKKAKVQAMNYVVSSNGKWFCALGAVGSGKSHLCTAICGQFLNAGFEVRYMLWRDDSRKIKAVVNDAEEYEKLVEPLKEVQVLYIDDFFKTGEQGISSADINLAFEILNARYIRKNLVTIISSELTIEKILNIDEAIGSRIKEKSRDFCLCFEGTDKNWRLR
jgi:DNA replication protein DnaC